MLLPLVAHAQEIFRENGKYGLKDYRGEVLLPAEYAQILLAGEGFLLCKALEGATSPIPPHTAEDLRRWAPENECVLGLDSLFQPFPFHPLLRYGYCPWNAGASGILPAQYAQVWPVGHTGLLQAYDGSLFHLWDPLSGRLIKPASETRICHVRRHDMGSGLVFRQQGLFGIFDESGKVRVKPQYRSIGNLQDMLVVSTDKGWFLMYPENFAVINKTPFDELLPQVPIEGGILYRQRGKYGLLDEYGKPGVFKPAYEGIMQVVPYVYAVKLGGKWGITHSDDGGIEEPYVPFEYDSIVPFPTRPEFVGVYRGGRLGVLMTDTWREILPPGPSRIYDPGYEGLYEWMVGEQDGRIGLMGTERFEWLLEPAYDRIQPVPSTGRVGAYGYVVAKGGKMGWVNAAYQTALPAEWDRIEVDEAQGILLLYQGGRASRYDLANGRMLEEGD
jgi:hypothetical protein